MKTLSDLRNFKVAVKLQTIVISSGKQHLKADIKISEAAVRSC